MILGWFLIWFSTLAAFGLGFVVVGFVFVVFDFTVVVVVVVLPRCRLFIRSVVVTGFDIDFGSCSWSTSFSPGLGFLSNVGGFIFTASLIVGFLVVVGSSWLVSAVLRRSWFVFLVVLVVILALLILFPVVGVD